MNEQYMTSFLQNIFTRPSTSFDIEMQTIVHPLATAPDTAESMPGTLSSDVDVAGPTPTNAHSLEKPAPSPDFDMERTMPGSLIPSATGMAHNALVLNTSVGGGNIPSGDFAFSADPVMVRLSEKTDDLHGKRRHLDDIGEGQAFTREHPKQSKSKNLAYVGTVH